MSEMTEIDALRIIDEAFSKIENQEAKDRIINWVKSKYSVTKSTTLETIIEEPKKKKTKPSSKGGSKNKHTMSIVKDLNLKQVGVLSFRDFAKQKAPESYYEQCCVAVFYLNNLINVENISPDHIYTCFKDIGWRVPANLYVMLAKTSSLKGWIDTSDMNQIKMTTHGENLIEHDLPKQKAKENK